MDTNMHARDPRLNATKGYTGTLGMGEQAREREREREGAQPLGRGSGADGMGAQNHCQMIVFFATFPLRAIMRKF